MTLQIRPAGASDVDALVAIEEASFSTDRISRRSFRRLLRSPGAATMVAVRDDLCAGYLVLLYRRGAGIARLYSIAVCEAAAGTGIARALLGAAEEAARARGCRSLRLEVREDNRRAIALYERSGYGMIGRRPGYYADGMTALRYEKPLSCDMISSGDRESAAVTSGERQPS